MAFHYRGSSSLRRHRIATYHEFTLRRISQVVLFEEEVHICGISGWWRPFRSVIRLCDLDNTIIWNAARDGNALSAVSCLAIGFTVLNVLPYASITRALKDICHLAPFLGRWLTPSNAHLVFAVILYFGIFQALFWLIRTHMVSFSGRASITLCSMSPRSSALLHFVAAMVSQIEHNKLQRLI